MTYRYCSLRRIVDSWARLGLISAFLFSIVMLLSGIRLAAQVPSGINGTVTDISGAVIVGAEVAATDKSTSVVSHAVTSSAGTYVIVGLNPGHYSVVVTASGFKKIRERGCVGGSFQNIGDQLPDGPWRHQYNRTGRGKCNFSEYNVSHNGHHLGA